MQGIGNDFVVVDTRKQKISFSVQQIKALANRHLGIGFDQLIIIGEPKDTSCDASYRFFNPDGSKAQQCGNGQRCIALYLHKLKPQNFKFKVSGLAGVICSEILKDNRVSVSMGKLNSIESRIINTRKCCYVDLGNPHLVIEVDDVASCDLADLYQQINPCFQQGVNLEIVQILSDKQIKIRVHERGTGETLACGSGACAAVIALNHQSKINHKATVLLPGGELMVEYQQSNNNIKLTGPARYIFTGEISL